MSTPSSPPTSKHTHARVCVHLHTQHINENHLKPHHSVWHIKKSIGVCVCVCAYTGVLIIFQRSSLKLFPIIKRLAITLMYCNRLHAWWSVTVFNFAFLFNCAPVGDFRLYDGSDLKTYLLMRW